MTGWCRGNKKRYATEKGANRGRMNLWGADPTVDLADLHVYECPVCKDGKGKPFWHVGHKSKFKQEKEKE